MTGLNRKVRRAAGDYVVILHPGQFPTIEVREKGRRAGFSVTVGGLHTMLAMRAADIRTQGRAARRVMRGRR